MGGLSPLSSRGECEYEYIWRICLLPRYNKERINVPKSKLAHFFYINSILYSKAFFLYFSSTEQNYHMCFVFVFGVLYPSVNGPFIKCTACMLRIRWFPTSFNRGKNIQKIGNITEKGLRCTVHTIHAELFLSDFIFYVGCLQLRVMYTLKLPTNFDTLFVQVVLVYCC